MFGFIKKCFLQQWHSCEDSCVNTDVLLHKKLYARTPNQTVS